MTYLITPETVFNIAGKDYTLSPAMECLKKIQHHFKKDILVVMQDMPETKFDDCAKVIEIAIADYGTTPPKLEVIEQWIVEEVGIPSIRNLLLAWLLLITTPKRDRGEMQEKLGESLKALGL